MGLFDKIGWTWTFKWTGYNKPMLEIEIKRLFDNQWATIGSLSMPGFQCDTIELPKQPYNGSKIRIPSGRYRMSLYNSPRWRRNVPLLSGVPERTYIEIHPSNYAIRPSDGHCMLEGCIALGTNASSVSVDASNATFDKFMGLISPSLWKEGEIWLTIRD